MPVQVTYPGVYIEEIPSGSRTVAGVATSITAFIGRAPKGPTDRGKEGPVTIFGFDDFERSFGGLNIDYPLTYAVKDFFENGGGQALIVRLFEPYFSSENARLAVADKAKAVFTNADSTDVTAYMTAVNAYPNSEEYKKSSAYEKKAFDQGLKAADKASKVANAAVDDVKKAAIEAAEGTIPSTKSRITLDGSGVAEAAARETAQAAEEKIPDPVPTDAAEQKTASQAVYEAAKKVTDDYTKLKQAADNNPNAAENVKAEAANKQAASKSVTDSLATLLGVTLETDGSVKDVTAANKLGEVKEKLGEFIQTAIDTTDKLDDDQVLVLDAANEGSWGSYLAVEIDRIGITDEVANVYGLKAADLFNLQVNFSPPTGAPASERFINVSVNAVSGDRRLDRVLSKESLLVRLAMNDDGIGARLPKATPLTGDTAGATQAQDSDALTIQSYSGNRNLKSGMYALQKADLFNLMCIPPDSRDETTPGWDTPISVYTEAAAYCQNRRAMLIVDPPKDWASLVETGQTANIKLSETYSFADSARNAAVYFPRVIKPDPLLKGHPSVFPACGMIAGVMSRTDVSRGVWKAPAGIDAGLAGVQGLEVKLSDDENGQLNPQGINCLRTFPVIGPVVWGARTMRGADQLSDDFKYVPVRRLTLYIEESLFRGTQWAVFEPNDQKLWTEMRGSADSFMTSLAKQGAFYSYEVICDKSTTTARDINLGIVNMVVAFAPVKPAEFVVIKIQQQALKD